MTISCNYPWLSCAQWLTGRAFYPLAGGRWFKPRSRYTKCVLNWYHMLPYLAISIYVYNRCCFSLLLNLVLKYGLRLEWAVERELVRISYFPINLNKIGKKQMSMISFINHEMSKMNARVSARVSHFVCLLIKLLIFKCISLCYAFMHTI